MEVNWQILLLSITGSFLAGLLVGSLSKWRIWVIAIVVSVAAAVVGAMFNPIIFELGNAFAAFLPALAGAALGSIIRRKRTV